MERILRNVKKSENKNKKKTNKYSNNNKEKETVKKYAYIIRDNTDKQMALESIFVLV